MVKQRSLGPDNLEDGSDPSSAFLDALRTRAMDEMHEAALEYGIILKDLGKRGTFLSKGSLKLTMFYSRDRPTIQGRNCVNYGQAYNQGATSAG
jgi:hypothetical protein